MRRKILGLLTSGAIAASGLVLVGGGVADAQRVANTGPGALRIDSGQIKVGNETFDAGSSGDQVVASFSGVNPNGTFTVNTLQFPPFPPIDGPLGQIDVTVELLSGSGSVNPLTGLASLNLSIRINIDGGGTGGDCRVSPINIAATTTALGGVPYNPTNGRVTLADRTFSVPPAQGCNTFPVNVNNEINSQLGLPSPSGNNFAVFNGFFDPIRTPAVVPSFTATPSTGFAPLLVNFNSAGTTTSRPNPTYQWDYTDDGSFDASGATTSFVYAVPGTYTARLRVTDDQGDFADTTRVVTVNVPRPDVTLDKSGPAAIVHGDAGLFTIDVGSEGQIAAAGATVVDTLPAGLIFTSSSGTGWSCLPTGQTVTCSSSDVVAPGDSFEPLVIEAEADGTVTGDVTNTATASTPNEIELSDNTDTADTRLVQPGIDIAIEKSHDPDQGLFLGQRATYILSVSNQGTLPTGQDEVTVVNDTLPAGTQLVGASGGSDWVCAPMGNAVSCFTFETVDPGESLNDIRIVVDLLPDVTSPLSNTATVESNGDSNAGNNSSTDTGEVLGFAVDYQIAKVHLGDLIVGEPATYGIGVQNIGTQTGGGTVTVTDDLPSGLTFIGAQGDGWTCGAVDQAVTCTHAGGVEPGDFLPGITLQATPDASAVPTVTNTVTVSGAGDVNPVNDTASDPGTVRFPQADLTITKGHQGNFTTGSNGTYTIGVRNVATERADGPTTVVDDLPAGLTFVSASGTGWACTNAGQQVTCTYAGVIAGQASAPPLSVVAVAPDGAPDNVVNTATVSNAGDANGANDTASDPTRIERRVPQPTNLDAEAIVLRVNVDQFLRLNVSILNAPRAVLTSGGVPVPGKVITFRLLNQTATLCTAVTNSRGVATCDRPLATSLALLTSLRYTADYAGDADFRSSRDEAALVILQGLQLI